MGYLGPGPTGDHVEHSLTFAVAWTHVGVRPPATVLDLGSGAGVPGLILALVWPESDVMLLEGSERRAGFLAEAVAVLGLDSRVSVRAQRAELAGRTDLRGTFSLVTARGFAAPAVTAECGAAFLAPGGMLAVAEPPGGNPARWPEERLALLGLAAGNVVAAPASVQLLHHVGNYPDRYPRRVGIPGKRPLW